MDFLTHAIAFLFGFAWALVWVGHRPTGKHPTGQRPPKAPPPTSTGDSVGNPPPCGIKPAYPWPPPPGRRVREGDVPPKPNPPA